MLVDNYALYNCLFSGLNAASNFYEISRSASPSSSLDSLLRVCGIWGRNCICDTPCGSISSRANRLLCSAGFLLPAGINVSYPFSFVKPLNAVPNQQPTPFSMKRNPRLVRRSTQYSGSFVVLCRYSRTIPRPHLYTSPDAIGHSKGLGACGRKSIGLEWFIFGTPCISARLHHGSRVLFSYSNRSRRGE